MIIYSYPSWAVLFVPSQVPHAFDIYKDMAEAGVVSRYRGKELHCEDCIRVTVGQPHENDSFLKLFAKTADKYLAKVA
jgi:histidinol-phosphate aminotransferase